MAHSPQYEWDPRLRSGAGAFRNRTTGRIVSQREVRDALDAVLDRFRADVRARALSVVRNQLSVDQFQLSMMDDILSAHIAAAALARGGASRLRESDRALIEERVVFNYERLERLVERFETRAISRAQFRAFAEMYADAPRNAFERVMMDALEEQGFDEARSIRRARDSCSSPQDARGCIQQEALGWQSTRDIILTGERVCGPRCRCYIEYRRSSTGETVRIDART